MRKRVAKYLDRAILLLFALILYSAYSDEDSNGDPKPIIYKDADNLNLALTDIYSNVNELFAQVDCMLPYLRSDDITVIQGSSSPYISFDRFNVLSCNALNRCWELTYSSIRSADYIIYNAHQAIKATLVRSRFFPTSLL
ncbi:hypothetical protein [Carboxylicivirga sp. N1Y90]|uniref:hypothetical protein n=1 Tax=Carboxylicivirga fragile TaxID=3417571 RepID=UPI003D3331B2|nr:hypothetical protein [Marinilabiliaceae bacterium N1Y90]